MKRPFHRAPAARHRVGIGGQHWVCEKCHRLLGVIREGRLHISVARGHEYFVGFPATCRCRQCGTLNRTTSG